MDKSRETSEETKCKLTQIGIYRIPNNLNYATSPPPAPSTSTQQQAELHDVPTTIENVGRKHNMKYDNYTKTERKTLRALHLFSGRSDRKDGLAAHLRAQG
jgi:hypothetical protein